MSALSLRFWRPESGEPVDVEVSDTAGIRTAVAEAAAEYRSAGVDSHPGVIVAADVDEPANSVILVPVPGGMALVHTDADFSQYVTRVEGAAGGPDYRVRMDDVIEVPASSRVSEDVGYALVDDWLRGDDLAQKEIFSDDLYGS